MRAEMLESMEVGFRTRHGVHREVATRGTSTVDRIGVRRTDRDRKPIEGEACPAAPRSAVANGVERHREPSFDDMSPTR